MRGVVIVPDEFNNVTCQHLEYTPLRYMTPNIEEPKILTFNISLTWQLQLDGTIRKVGKCRQCGKVVATGEVK